MSTVQTNPEPSIFELFDKVRNHPEFVAGTFWCEADFDGRDLDEFHTSHFTDCVVAYGNELIDSELGYAEGAA